jgi:hypothetical protein
MTKNSLGGQNNHGRMSGARSSRASSTNFKKLQRLDREIGELQKRNAFLGIAASYINTIGSEYKNHLKKIKKLDLKRKEVRIERKKYKV